MRNKLASHHRISMPLHQRIVDSMTASTIQTIGD